MANRSKKPPYSWFRWQMRPRIWDDEKYGDLKNTKSAENEENGEGDLAKEIAEEKEKIELEKGDLFAMILSAMITIFPVCVGVLLLIVFLAYFMFLH